MRNTAVVPTYENRRFTRLAISRQALVALPSGEILHGEVIELSLCGIRLTVKNSLPSETVFTTRFPFEDDKEIEIKAMMVSRDRDTVTAEITGIKEDTFDNLRELLVSNSEEPGRIDTEIIERGDFLPGSY